MTVNRTHKYLICLGLTLLLPMTASAEKLAEIPVKKFRMSRRSISLSHLGDIHARQIVANGNNALINCGRSIWSLVASTGKLEEKEVSALDSSSTWYGPACAIEDGFLIAVQGYPEEQRRREESISRGDFRAGPRPNGVLILSPCGGTAGKKARNSFDTRKYEAPLIAIYFLTSVPASVMCYYQSTNQV